MTRILQLTPYSPQQPEDFKPRQIQCASSPVYRGYIAASGLDPRLDCNNASHMLATITSRLPGFLMLRRICRPLNEIISNSCHIRDYDRSEDHNPISATGQSSISNDVETSVPNYKDTSRDHPFPTAKSHIFVFEHRIVSSTTFPPDEYAPIIRMNRKARVIKEKNVAPLISLLIHIHCCPLPASKAVPCC
ncbi:hypothetical protein TNCV_1036461 [Trichonephila clavipes]|nr:hypothetical protein TNCV_1036461 [Trichonephila clavipes]